MKKNSFIILSFLTNCFLIAQIASGQTTYFQDFESINCTTTDGCSSTPAHPSSVLTSTCFSDGGASHGTPHIEADGSNLSVRMGGGSSLGEGFFINYTFEGGEEYEISFRYKKITGFPVPTNPVINLYAVNGLSHNTDCTIGSPPTPTDQETIDNLDISSETSGQWYEETIVFCFESSDDLAQLLIYPSATSGDFVLNIDDIEIIPKCFASVTFTSSFFPTFYRTAGTITTENASTTIENDPSETTIWKAGQSITLKPKTLISISSSGPYFLAEIEACTGCGTGGSLRTDLTQSKERIRDVELEILNQQSDEILIFPNPGKSTVIILANKLSGIGENLSNTNIPVKIYDSLGKEVYSNDRYIFGELMQIHHLNDGVYYVSIFTEKRVLTKKILIKK